MSGQKRVISLFSGAGTFDYGFHLAGWETVYLCEWDEKARQVLRHRFPGVPLTNDVCEINGADLPDAEVIMFGSPCQDLSVAGKRAGLDGVKSGLFMEAIRIIKEKREATNGRYPAIALWENVPGAFSSNGGRDFATVIHEFLNSGARDVCWRVLDAQFFGVPQRRRRIFVVADFGGERAREILFESEGVRRDSVAGGPAGPAVAALTARGVGTCGADDNQAQAGHLIATEARGEPVVQCLTTGTGKRYDLDTESFILSFQQNSMDGSGTLGVDCNTEVLRPVKPQADHQMIGLPPAYAVRRLTPTECERLQGMPDGWGDVDGMADSHRYRFMGNGGAAPVLRWIAERMAAAL
ncbi:DNA (cytosine-5-)-methyltransferase (plasmid) [Deinococcus sp. D7000]|nr:DNA (cytosine-5-)-methyltransferase [Deinococcus sp. D7000]QLG13552.1 DNA (cytosine-5-)-methyltransferase [Deinococcus sp. D7000]